MSNEFIINGIMSKWEMQRRDVDDIEQVYDYALVLVGHPSRLNRAIEMYRKGKTKNICVIGRLKNKNLKAQLVEIGIPEEHLFFESKSRNTYEHAFFFEDFMAEVRPQALDTSRLVIITSGYHMRRAKMCFDKQDVETETFSTAFISYDPKHMDLLDILPNPLAMYHWKRLIKEWFGILSYKVMGYI